MNLIEKKWNEKVTYQMIIQERDERQAQREREYQRRMKIAHDREIEVANEERGGKEKRSASVAYCCRDGECGRSVRPGL